MWFFWTTKLAGNIRTAFVFYFWLNNFGVKVIFWLQQMLGCLDSLVDWLRVFFDLLARLVLIFGVVVDHYFCFKYYSCEWSGKFWHFLPWFDLNSIVCNLHPDIHKMLDIVLSLVHFNPPCVLNNSNCIMYKKS